MSCSECLVYGSVQVKAKKCWEEGSRGMEKNVSLRSGTEKWDAEAGICDKRVYGFETKGWIGTTAMLMRQRSWTRREWGVSGSDVIFV